MSYSYYFDHMDENDFDGIPYISVIRDIIVYLTSLMTYTSDIEDNSSSYVVTNFDTEDDPVSVAGNHSFY